MSDVALCDYCNEIFKVGEEGAQRFTGTASTTNEKGQVEHKNTVMDKCGVCVAAGVGMSRSRPAIEASVEDRSRFVKEVDGR